MMDNSKLRQLPAPDLARYLRGLSNQIPEAKITSHLFAAVEHESLAPTVLTLWLSIARTTETLLQALKQEFSVYVRRAAIKRFLKIFRSKRWEEAWDGIGGTAVILELLAQFSVADVKLCLNRIHRYTNGPRRGVKVTELFQGLHPLLFPNYKHTSLDERPLGQNYLALLEACSPEFLQTVIQGKNPANRYKKELEFSMLSENYEMARELCLDIIFKSREPVSNLNIFLRPLLGWFPATASPRPGYSEPMLFSLTLLQRLAAAPDAKVHQFIVLRDLVDPLIKRIRRRRLGRDYVKVVLDLATSYMATDQEERTHIEITQDSFLHAAVMQWAVPGHDGWFAGVLKLLRDKPRTLGQYFTMLWWVKKPQRYSLLKLVFLHARKEAVDIDDASSLNTMHGKWPQGIFQSLGTDHAIQLLKRIAESRQDFLESGSVDDLLFSLRKPEMETFEVRQARVEEAKKKAQTCRDQMERAGLVKAALQYAINTDSLDVYSDTLMWARRYIRDPLTVKAIFTRSTLSSALNLLSTISPVDKVNLVDVQRNIPKANQIILDVIETACSAINEPSFYQPDWNGPLELLGDVVNRRIELAEKTQVSFKLSDDETYDLLWKGTLEVAIRVEEIGLKPEFEVLQRRKPGGIIQYKYHHLKDASPTTFRFIDELARRRDEIWCQFRPTLRPGVAALPSQVPRGLPIQCFPACVTAAYTPYILSRAEAVVLANPKFLQAVPEDEETREAIGMFVDNYDTALEIYLRHEDADGRKKKAWDHALKYLSGRMDLKEAHRTWQPVFKAVSSTCKWKPSAIDPPTSMGYPVLPFDAEVGEYLDWNPLEDFKPPVVVKSRTLEPLTFLDLALSNDYRYFYDLDGSFRYQPLGTVGVEPPRSRLWDLDRMEDAEWKTPAIREGLTVSAMLYLEQQIPDSHVLAKPFPSKADVRYPDIWLDLSELGTEGDEYSAQNCLKCLVTTIPPTLLYRITTAALEAVFKEEAQPKLERLAYSLLSLLAAGDRPALATDLILKVVIEKPDASSWHRQLLTMRFLNTLSATQAKNLIQSFADAIQAKMKEQSYGKSYIKVTTVKYFAQLLNGTKFVAPGFAVNVLSQLFTSSTHIDIRVSIVESLIGMLAGCTEATLPLGKRVIQALKAVVPIAGSLNEREATNWDELPCVFDGKPPILEAILGASPPLFLESEFYNEITFPIFKASVAENGRWLEMFVKSHNLEIGSLKLPRLSVKPDMVIKLLQRSKFQSRFLELFHQYTLANMSPPQEAVALNEKLRTREYRDLPESKHWLSLYGQGCNSFTLAGVHLVWLLQTEEGPEVPSRVQEMVFEQAKTLLFLNQPETFKLFMDNFGAKSHWQDIYWDWLKASRPVLERIITLIDSLRTDDWNFDQNRQPEVLPQTLQYKLWLLPYPEKEADNFEEFGKEFRKYLDGIYCVRYNPNDLGISMAVLLRITPCHRAEVACNIAKGMSNLMYIEVGKSLFQMASVPRNKGVVETSREVVKGWAESVRERIRMMERELRGSKFNDKEWEKMLYGETGY